MRRVLKMRVETVTFSTFEKPLFIALGIICVEQVVSASVCDSRKPYSSAG